MPFWKWKYLSDEQIKGFDSYKYSSIDSSPLAVYISHPFWNQVVKLYPMWLAPNVLTFLGMILVVAAFLLVSCYDYYLLASSDDFPLFPPVPNWVWLVCSIFTFVAHVADGTDGKQARRTGASGPTGELFDHGIDSYMTITFTVTAFSVFGCADYSLSALRLLLFLMMIQLVFYVTHWEKYNTGILFLSWCYDASQYFLTIFYLFTWWKGGYKYWKFDITVPLLGIQLSPAEIYELTVYGGGFFMSLPMSAYNIYISYKMQTGKMRSPYEALLPGFPIFILFSAAIAWAVLSPMNVLDADPKIFYWAMGTIFSNIACRLIVSQMTNTRCETFNFLLLPYLILATLFLTIRNLGVWELYSLRAVAAFVTLAHIHYGCCVVRQMCDHFDINCFTIKKRNN